ncbi:MAG: DUF1553/Planctomycete cytochrome C/NPCBM/NEW2 domain-containing protein [Verrucomicrobia bacterium]|nr:MAG: DUF1553/Planctomycete cytochrome C/NPCBM/NEW2 domain-containing protein [Verrucomicrobiota bacterium]
MKTNNSRHRLLKITGCLLFAFVSTGVSAVDFDSEIRPLLKERCVECHGDKKQKGELRLDLKPHFQKGGHGGPVIVPGKADTSPLYARLLSKDPDERMPPKGEPLNASQIAKFKEWIEGGGSWPENDADKAASFDKRMQHWSVQPLPKSFPADAGVDFYIVKSLEKNGLPMAPEADRRTLIRRLFFDLAGLPPSPERVERFIADTSSTAYADLVEELLASPNYGERWARHWLDIAHYADTHGFERDQIRPAAWIYRDYVINALNADKPYDQFLSEQIAGDAFAPNSPEAIAATGFLAAGPWDFVGHVETKSPALKRAARAGDLDDIVTQVITSTMGITLNCARCHDHKLDPISQREYYSMCAVFSGVKRGARDLDPNNSARLSNEKAALEKQLEIVAIKLRKSAPEHLDLADIVGGGDGFGSGLKASGIVLGSGAVTIQKLAFNGNAEHNKLVMPVWTDKKSTLKYVKGVFLPKGDDEAKPTVKITEDIVLSGIPKTSGQTWDAIRNGPLNAQVSTKIGETDYNSKGHSILGLHANGGITFDLTEIRRGSGLKAMKLTGCLGFGASPSAAKTKADFAVYIDQSTAFQETSLTKDASRPINISIPESARFLSLVATDGGDGISSDLLFFGDASLEPEETKSALNDSEKDAILQLRKESDRLKTAIAELKKPEQIFSVVSEEKPPTLKIHRRGNPEDEGDEVNPTGFTWPNHAPVHFGDNSTPEGQRRIALAKWITDPSNPLTSRVLVNRLWHHHFGQGIVTTPSDFGLGGDLPSHPELLDWLACEFLRSGWSLKAVHRTLLLSRAYKQSSTATHKEAERTDSMNRLLWRQNPRRLDAESLRDSVLSVTGQLNAERGGPGFRDFKYTEAYAPIYEYIIADKPELCRRSIYRFIVRTTPHRFLSTFDCPDPSNLTPARSQTTTALQALALSNNEFILQQARHLQKRIESETSATPDAIRRAFALCLQRPPTPEEREASERLVASRGLFALCRMLLNSNEFVYLD